MAPPLAPLDPQLLAQVAPPGELELHMAAPKSAWRRRLPALFYGAVLVAVGLGVEWFFPLALLLAVVVVLTGFDLIAVNSVPNGFDAAAFNATHQQAEMLLRAGDLTAARPLTERLARIAAAADVHALALHLLAVVARRQGEAALAEQLHAAIARNPPRTGHVIASMDRDLAVELAIDAALAGETKRAAAWLAHPAPKQLSGIHGSRCRRRLAAALIAGREGLFEACRAELEPHWLHLEHGLDPWELKLARLLWATACRPLGLPEQTRAQLIRGTKPLWAGQFEGLAATWPAFAEVMP